MTPKTVRCPLCSGTGRSGDWRPAWRQSSLECPGCKGRGAITVSYYKALVKAQRLVRAARAARHG